MALFLRLLQFVKSLPISFSTLMFEFILALLLFKFFFNIQVLVIYKFLKRITIISGRNILTIEA